MSGKFTVYRQSNAQVCGLSVSVYLTHNLIVFRFQRGFNVGTIKPFGNLKPSLFHILGFFDIFCVLRLKLIYCPLYNDDLPVK